MRSSIHWTKLEIEQLRLLSKKLLVKDIAPKLRKSWGAVNMKMARLGLKSIYRPNPDYSDYFKKWTRKLAYLLGVMVTDGNICSSSNYCTSITSKDLDWLEIIQKSFPFDWTICKGHGGSCFYLRKGGKNFYDNFKSLGLIERKSFSTNPHDWDFIDQIPAEYFWDFFLGCMDGDGCITKSNMVIIGKVDFIRKLFFKLEEHLGKFLESDYRFSNSCSKTKLQACPHYQKDIFNLWFNRDASLLIGEKMYSDPILCLKRKKIAFEFFKNKRRIKKGNGKTTERKNCVSMNLGVIDMNENIERGEKCLSL